MARTATKRKSESALPTGMIKQRKNSGARRQNSDSNQGGDESSDQLFVDKQPLAPKHVKKSNPKSRKSEPVMHVTKADEYEEDEGRMESQQFLALVEFESRKKRQAVKAANDYMNKFTKYVNSEEQALKERRKSLSAASTHLDKTFLEAFTNAYAASRPTAPPTSKGSRGKGSASEASFATLYERSKKITAKAINLVEAFEKANEKTTQIKVTELTSNTWEEENETVEKVIAIGRIAGLRKYEALTAGVEEPEIDEDMVVYAEAIYKPEEEFSGVGWGKMVGKQDKAVKKLQKSCATDLMA